MAFSHPSNHSRYNLRPRIVSARQLQASTTSKILNDVIRNPYKFTTTQSGFIVIRFLLFVLDLFWLDFGFFDDLDLDLDDLDMVSFWVEVRDTVSTPWLVSISISIESRSFCLVCCCFFFRGMVLKLDHDLLFGSRNKYLLTHKLDDDCWKIDSTELVTKSLVNLSTTKNYTIDTTKLNHTANTEFH